jgi:hypothetical protein
MLNLGGVGKVTICGLIIQFCRDIKMSDYLANKHDNIRL